MTPVAPTTSSGSSPTAAPSTGPRIQKVFADSGNYTGNVTATDFRGNKTVKNFTVTVTNVAPVADAGPDGSGAWGRAIAFNGAGTDPGSADQSTLVYQWDFGDGSPSATGGPSVLHAYATPNAVPYTATLTVCDKDGACDTDTRSVTVRKRTTTASYLGATSVTYDTPSSLQGSLVDEYGQAVNGRTLAFSVDGNPKGSANTNSSGTASVAYTPTETAGTYATAAEFAGDALYEPASSVGSVVVDQKGTTLAYTGALSGGPNKTVTLSAVLKDATGKPVVGRMVDFALGAQAVSATTDANGVAKTTLKLSQKKRHLPADGDLHADRRGHRAVHRIDRQQVVQAPGQVAPIHRSNSRRNLTGPRSVAPGPDRVRLDGLGVQTVRPV